MATPGGTGASSGDGFGYAIATAHINSDPCLDVVIGAPWHDVDGRADVGAAYVVYGSPKGLGKGRAGTVLTPDAWNGSAPNSLFGFSLAGADALGPDRPAIAIGAPYTDRPGKPNAGAAYMMWFRSDGTPHAHKRYFEDQPRTEEGAVASGLYGWSVALGALHGDPVRTDLVVGAPREPWNKEKQPGAVELIADASKPEPSAVMTLGPPDLGVPSGRPSRIGYALAYAAAGGTHYLAAGVPGAQVKGKDNAGAVALFRSDGHDFARSDVLTEGERGSTTAVENADQYGRSVALGVDRDGRVRLGVGIPYETSRMRHDGAVQIVPITGGGKARDLNQMLPGVPGDPGESAHFGLSVGFADGKALLIGVPDDRGHPTGSVIEAPAAGPLKQILPPAGQQAMDFGMGM